LNSAWTSSGHRFDADRGEVNRALPRRKMDHFCILFRENCHHHYDKDDRRVQIYSGVPCWMQMIESAIGRSKVTLFFVLPTKNDSC
jgi:hypothetical protein